jgi:hypothetical protein
VILEISLILSANGCGWEGSLDLFIATSTRGERKLLVIGLEQENIKRLLNDEPIYKNFEKDLPSGSGLEEWDVIILGPEDLIRFASHYGITRT